MENRKLGAYFTIDEFTHSEYAIRRGIANDPDIAQIETIKNLCKYVLDPIRRSIGVPVVITSGFRCQRVNKGIGGSASSQHMIGAAADVKTYEKPLLHTFNWIVAMMQVKNPIPIDQLILEYGSWIHVSWSNTPRHEILVAEKIGTKTVYQPYSIPNKGEEHAAA